MKKYADYIYKNIPDTARVRIYKTESNEWDCMVIFKNPSKQPTYSGEDLYRYFRTKSEAKEWASGYIKETENLCDGTNLTPYGTLRSINPDNLTAGW